MGRLPGMIDPSRVVSIHPYFRVKPGKLAEAKAKLSEFISKTSQEAGNLYYDFTIRDDVVFCREAYDGAAGLLKHLDNVGTVLGEFLGLADVIRVEVHGAAAELEKLKGPLSGLKPEWFVFECGGRRSFPS
jgi:hypothetical protein